LGGVGSITIIQFLYSIDAGGLQQLGIFLAHAFDAHAVGHIGPAEQALFVDPGLGGERLAAFDRARLLKQARSRSDPSRLQDRRNVAIDPFYVGDGVGHKRLLTCLYLVSKIACGDQANWLKPGIALAISASVSLPAF